MSCDVGCRRSLDLTLLWLWCKLVAAALIRPLAWESPCAVGGALENGKKKNHESVYIAHLDMSLSKQSQKPGAMLELVPFGRISINIDL